MGTVSGASSSAVGTRVNSSHRIACVVVGIVFLIAGVGKLLLPVLTPLLYPGAPTFADVLASLGVPFAKAMAVAVSAAEIATGVALLAGRLVFLASVAMIGNMLGALATLSIPATFLGKPLRLGGLSLGNEIWRVPLEVALIAALAWIAYAYRPKFGKA